MPDPVWGATIIGRLKGGFARRSAGKVLEDLERTIEAAGGTLVENHEAVPIVGVPAKL